MRVVVQTHGCRLNRSETDAMVAALGEAGHQVVDGVGDAEVLVLNTCTITHRADADARRAIRRACRGRPGLKVLVTGCFAQAEPSEVAKLPGVVAVLGNGAKADVVRQVGALGRGEAVGVTSPPPPQTQSLVQLRASPGRDRGRALLKVQDGCNYGCAFCIVPRVRGRSRSVAVPTIVEELKALIEREVPEVVLTGAHLGTWGRDLRPRMRLHELVAALLPHLGGARLRLSSIDPHEVDEPLIDLLAAHPERLCRHLHLPVQSGDPQILRTMRRGHGVEEFVSLVTTLAERIDGIGIGTDVIVGFPGEDEDAFERTHAMLASLPLSYHHVFSFSPRRDTPAATMTAMVPPEEIGRRNRVLRDLSAAQHRRFATAMAGQVVDAVTEPGRSGGWRALTDNYVRLCLHEPMTRRCRVRVRVDGQGRGASLVMPSRRSVG